MEGKVIILMTTVVVSVFAGCIQQINTEGIKVNFDFAPETPTIVDTIQFVSISYSQDGTIVKWLWDFGDGNTSTQQDPTHRYNVSGTYKVTLTVWDTNGDSKSISKNVTVNETPNDPPSTPSVSAKSLSSKQPFIFYLFYATSADPDGDKIRYYFDWGDNTTSSSMTVSSTVVAKKHHAWSRPGTYTIKVKAVDERGAESSWSLLNITIGEQQPATDFTLATIDGEIFNLSAYRGKAVLLSFTSTACGFCKEELEEFKDIYEEVGDQLVMLSIFVQSFNPYTETLENVSKMKEEIDAKWMFALDTDETDVTGKFIESHEELLSVPTHFVIDKNGFISFSKIGYIEKTQLLEEIMKVI